MIYYFMIIGLDHRQIDQTEVSNTTPDEWNTGEQTTTTILNTQAGRSHSPAKCVKCQSLLSLQLFGQTC